MLVKDMIGARQVWGQFNREMESQLNFDSNSRIWMGNGIEIGEIENTGIGIENTGIGI